MRTSLIFLPNDPGSVSEVSMSNPPLPKSCAGEVLAAVTDAMTRPPTAAALAHFPSIRAQTARVSADFEMAVVQVDEVVQWFRAQLENDTLVKEAFRDPADAAPFRQIVPILLENFQRLSRKLLATTKPAGRAASIDELDRIEVRHDDFINLGVVVRQFIDSMIETAYQSDKLDPRAFNYQFFDSLVSFAPVAPLSLNSRLYSDKIQQTVQSFALPKGRRQRVEAYASNEHSCFAERVDFLAGRVEASQWCRDGIKLVFKFCSDLVHLGYASDVVLGGSRVGQIVLGVAGDYYTASAENFAEVKLRLLRQCAHYYVEFFIAACKASIQSMLVGASKGVGMLDAADRVLSSSHGLADRAAFEFIRDGLVGSDRTIDIECGRCGDWFSWAPPHHRWDCYCRGCGALFEIRIVPEAIDYMVSVEGESIVLGSDAPDISDLPLHLREKLRRIRQRHIPMRETEEMHFCRITDIEHVDEETLVVDTLCTVRPAMDAQFQLIGYVAHKALSRQEHVYLICACGASVQYSTTRGDLLCQCTQCDQIIGIFGVSGDGAHVVLADAPDGTPQLAPIHEQRSLVLRGQ